MATWPAKTNYATGDVLTAAQMQDIGNALNSVGSAQYAAGKNIIINGDFRLNQRNFTSITTTGVYGFDRWISAYNDGTNTMTPQTFTAGTAPVAGYEAINYVRLQSSGQTAAASLSAVVQRVEDVRTFAGQTITVSFWAKASTGTPNIVAYAQQNFGSGGSTTVNNGPTSGKKAISTSWARYSFVIPIASISGKTIGSGNYLAIVLTQSAGTDRDSYTDSLGIQSVTIDYWGVQAESGSVATPFQTATGTLAGELAACQRYYYRTTATATAERLGTGFNFDTTQAFIYVPFPVQMRIKPTALEQSGTAGDYSVAANATVTCSAVPTFQTANPINATVVLTVASGLTAGYGAFARAVNSNAYLGWSAEL